MLPLAKELLRPLWSHQKLEEPGDELSLRASWKEHSPDDAYLFSSSFFSAVDVQSCLQLFSADFSVGHTRDRSPSLPQVEVSKSLGSNFLSKCSHKTTAVLSSLFVCQVVQLVVTGGKACQVGFCVQRRKWQFTDPDGVTIIQGRLYL